MKISYQRRWNKETGTVYHQTFRITKQENDELFGGQWKDGMNYGNAHTGAFIASKIHGIPGYEKAIERIITGNSAVFVGNGKIPIY